MQAAPRTETHERRWLDRHLLAHQTVLTAVLDVAQAEALGALPAAMRAAVHRANSTRRSHTASALVALIRLEALSLVFCEANAAEADLGTLFESAVECGLIEGSSLSSEAAAKFLLAKWEIGPA